MRGAAPSRAYRALEVTEIPGRAALEREGGEIGVDERAVSRRGSVEGVNEAGRAAGIAGGEWARPRGHEGSAGRMVAGAGALW